METSVTKYGEISRHLGKKIKISAPFLQVLLVFGYLKILF